MAGMESCRTEKGPFRIPRGLSMSVNVAPKPTPATARAQRSSRRPHASIPPSIPPPHPSIHHALHHAVLAAARCGHYLLCIYPCHPHLPRRAIHIRHATAVPSPSAVRSPSHLAGWCAFALAEVTASHRITSYPSRLTSHRHHITSLDKTISITSHHHTTPCRAVVQAEIDVTDTIASHGWVLLRCSLLASARLRPQRYVELFLGPARALQNDQSHISTCRKSVGRGPSLGVLAGPRSNC